MGGRSLEKFMSGIGAKKVGSRFYKIPVDAITADDAHNYSRDGRAHTRDEIENMAASLLAEGEQLQAGEVGVDTEAGVVTLHTGFRRVAAWRLIQERSGETQYFLAHVRKGNREKVEDRNFTENACRVGLSDMQVARQLHRLRKTRDMPAETKIDEDGNVVEEGMDRWLRDRGTPRSTDWINKTLRLNDLIKPLQNALHNGVKGFPRGKAVVVAGWDADRQRAFWSSLKQGKKPAAKRESRRWGVKKRKALAAAMNERKDSEAMVRITWSQIATMLDVLDGDDSEIADLPQEVRDVLGAVTP